MTQKIQIRTNITLKVFISQNQFSSWDSALVLRSKFDNGEHLTQSEIAEHLNNSELVKKLTDEIIDNPMFYVWRIIALSEIPYSSQSHPAYLQHNVCSVWIFIKWR